MWRLAGPSAAGQLGSEHVISVETRETSRAELSRMVAKEFETAIDELGCRQGEDRAEAVHEARKCVKKTRAVLRLLKQNLGDDYGVLAGRLRRMAHQLSSLRDADAGPEMMNALRDHYPRIVTRSMSEPSARAARRVRAPRWRVSIPIGCCRVSRERSSDRGREYSGEFAARHTPARYGPASGGAIDARERRWRVSARILKIRRFTPGAVASRITGITCGCSKVAPAALHVRIRRLKQLETWLGDDHNLVMLRATILEAPARFGDERMTAVVLGCVAKYQTTLRRRALKSGRQLFASTPVSLRHTGRQVVAKGRARST
jgi:hypothetical protein